ncbi:hypothetical protein AMECASPLE_025350 [Ameca splendens]|uniref:Uncharacterized protein n=1 Tax=Ameca splendens TaxID=208324 RepID=A0ABV0ZRE6_9TELE
MENKMIGFGLTKSDPTLHPQIPWCTKCPPLITKGFTHARLCEAHALSPGGSSSCSVPEDTCHMIGVYN